MAQHWQSVNWQGQAAALPKTAACAIHGAPYEGSDIKAELDDIPVLRQGRIDAIGSYDELLRDHAEFRRMAEA